MNLSKAVGPGVGVIGPEGLNIPNCVKLNSTQDQVEFKEFIETIIKKIQKKTQEHALDSIADMIAKQNVHMAELVKKLGG